MIAARLAFALLAPLAMAAAPPAPPPMPDASSGGRILVFSRTAGWRHDSIPVAVATLRSLAGEAGLAVDHTEDAGAFSPGNLARYRAVVFANTTGDLLDAAQQAAMEDFVRSGGGFVGVHAAADTEYDWPWYGALVGAYFHSHPPGLQATRVRPERDGRAAGDPWPVTDELYNYRHNPRGRVQVIATVDERDYAGGTMGEDHPIVWCHPHDGGRAWYTGLGHDASVYADARFAAHLARGLRYTARLSDDC